MKFGKSIGSQQGSHVEFHYVDYKALKKRIKDVVECLQAHELAGALTANTGFEGELAAEINRVNGCFARCQQELLQRTGALAEDLQHRGPEHVGAAADSVGCVEAAFAPGGAARPRPEAFRTLVGILGEVDQLRKYAVWNAVAVVKILKKRRKQTSFGLEDTAAERAGWLSRQSFFSGSDFAELHAAIESLGHMLVLSELAPARAEASQPQQQETELQQCPICLDTISDMVELSCHHRFCWKCFVLGPIAHQPGEYRITQCPICRKETSQSRPEHDDGEEDSPAEGVCVPSSEGLLSRFLHTYFPQGGPQQALLGGEDADEQEARREGEQSEREMRDVVGELVRALLADASWRRPSQGASAAAPPRAGEPGLASASDAARGDFFQTLPPKSHQDRQLIGAAQKLQWLQLASTGDPLALDSTAYCSLCSEPLLMEVVVTTPCKHHFHRVCINRLDLPQCPLCSTKLPFSWFLPAEHPCADRGFQVVSSRNYHPHFAGGPSKGSCGYPLSRPPPVTLHGVGGVLMKSYLHRCAPTGEECGGLESPLSPAPASPLRRPADTPDGGASSASDSSSEEDSGSDGGCDDAYGGGSRRGRRRGVAYGAAGRMRLLASPPCRATPACTGPGVGGAGRVARSRAPPPLAEGSAAGSGAGQLEALAPGPRSSRVSEPEQRNPKVLLIGNHV